MSVEPNDAPAGIAKKQQKENERELPATSGIIDVTTFLTALTKIGYDGPVRLEPFNKVVKALDHESACAASSAALHWVAGTSRIGETDELSSDREMEPPEASSNGTIGKAIWRYNVGCSDKRVGKTYTRVPEAHPLKNCGKS